MTLIRYDLNEHRLKVYFVGLPVFRLKCNHFIYRFFMSYRKRVLFKSKLKEIFSKQKIRVGFLVSESSKWTCQSVYDEFLKNNRFEPVVLVTKLYNTPEYYKPMDDCYNFFKQKGLNVILVYDEFKQEYIDLKSIGIDVLFYQQPWLLDYIQSPIVISKSALLCYVPYGIGLADNKDHYMESFHRMLDMFFVLCDDYAKHLNSITNNINNVIVVGSPKLDWYIQNKFRKKSDKKTNKKIVIYAPHHSFEKGSLEMATFQYNGMDILNFAKNNSDKFHWVFKPHPRFKHAVIMNNIMTEQEIDDYYKEWKKIGDIYEGGDYFGIFQQSGAMITDCCSFLGEYLPSGHPLFHLKNPRAKLNSIGERISSTYYVCNNFAEFEQLFTRVITDKDDYKQNERNMCIKQIFDPNQKVSAKIVEKIKDLIDKGK